MKSIVQNQTGATLLEMVVMIIIMGVVLPVLFSTISYISVQSAEYSVMEQAVVLAEQRMEEIIGQKEADWDWYKTPNMFAATESLADGFERTTTVNSMSNWGNGAIDAWEVRVTVTHTDRLPAGYALVVRFTKYVEQ